MRASTGRRSSRRGGSFTRAPGCRAFSLHAAPLTVMTASAAPATGRSLPSLPATINMPSPALTTVPSGVGGLRPNPSISVSDRIRGLTPRSPLGEQFLDRFAALDDLHGPTDAASVRLARVDFQGMIE